METYECLIITGKDIEPIPPIDNVVVDLKVNIQQNKSNVYDVTLYNIADKIKNLVINKSVTATLYFSKERQLEIPDIKFEYNNNNIKFTTDKITYKSK